MKGGHQTAETAVDHDRPAGDLDGQHRTVLAGEFLLAVVWVPAAQVAEQVAGLLAIRIDAALAVEPAVGGMVDQFSDFVSQHPAGRRVDLPDHPLRVRHVNPFGQGVGHDLQVVSFTAEGGTALAQAQQQDGNQSHRQRRGEHVDGEFFPDGADRSIRRIGNEIGGQIALDLTDGQEGDHILAGPHRDAQHPPVSLLHGNLHGRVASQLVVHLRHGRRMGILDEEIGVEGRRMVEAALLGEIFRVNAPPIDQQDVLPTRQQPVHGIDDRLGRNAGRHRSQMASLPVDGIDVAEAGAHAADLESIHVAVLGIGDFHRVADGRQCVTGQIRLVETQVAGAVGLVKMQLQQLVRLHGLVLGIEPAVEPVLGLGARGAFGGKAFGEHGQDIRTADDVGVKAVHGDMVHLDAGVVGGGEELLLLREMQFQLAFPVDVQEYRHPDAHAAQHQHQEEGVVDSASALVMHQELPFAGSGGI